MKGATAIVAADEFAAAVRYIVIELIHSEKQPAFHVLVGGLYEDWQY